MESETPALESRSFRLVLEYDGAAYAGWQRQARSPSVQQTLEEALESLVGHPVRVHAAGRTDAGVHAAGQVVRFETTRSTIDADGVLRGGNTQLPQDVRIVEAARCEHCFNPRRDARRRWYRYRLLARKAPPALCRTTLVHEPRILDWDRVEEALAVFHGEHDFRAFRSSSCTATRTLLTMEEAAHAADGDLHFFDFRCRSFLHNQIRLMVGAALDVGAERLTVESLREMLATGRRTHPFRCAAPCGLCLMQVFY